MDAFPVPSYVGGRRSESLSPGEFARSSPVTSARKEMPLRCAASRTAAMETSSFSTSGTALVVAFGGSRRTRRHFSSRGQSPAASVSAPAGSRTYGSSVSSLPTSKLLFCDDLDRLLLSDRRVLLVRDLGRLRRHMCKGTTPMPMKMMTEGTTIATIWTVCCAED